MAATHNFDTELDSLDLRGLPLGHRLRLRRVALGLTQTDLAQRAGTTQSRVAAVETGSERLRSAIRCRIEQQINRALREAEAVQR